MKEKEKIRLLIGEIEKLQGRVKELEAMENTHARLEQELSKRTKELEQNVREINTLYRVSRLIEERTLSADDILQKTVSVLTESFGQRPARRVRITMGNQVFESEKGFECLRSMSYPLTVDGRTDGALEVGYDETELREGERQLVAAVGGILSRIIEKKQTEKTLLEGERSFRTLVENSPTGIFIVQNGRIVYENPEEKRLSGPLSHLFRKGDLSNIHPDDMMKVREGFKKIMAGEARNLDIDFRFFADESTDMPAEMKWVHCRASLIDYMGGEALLVNKLDMTRTKALEFLLTTEDKMASLGRVASGMAHEIRNPLSGINIYLSNLEKIIDDSEGARKAKEIIAELQSASNRIESVIRRVMDFSKPSEPKFLRININHTILNAINFSSVTLRKAGIEVNMSLAEDLPQCDADPHLIEQVILNLITNAKEAMKKTVTKKAIHVASSLRSDQITVTVSDVGPGIPVYMRKRIFDPFYTTKDGNTGIGLSLCHRIIIDHGGSLTVRDSDLGGAEFKIELPLKREKKAL